jgi:hypothetical protein
LLFSGRNNALPSKGQAPVITRMQSEVSRAAERGADISAGGSITYQKVLVELFRAIAAEEPGARTRLAQVLTTTLPETARFVARALDAARMGDHRRTRESHGGVGVDF